MTNRAILVIAVLVLFGAIVVASLGGWVQLGQVASSPRKSMANEEHVRVVKRGSEAIDLWRESHPGERLDLRMADLCGSRLNHANLDQAALSGADLQSARLEVADLQGADLRNANLSRAHLPVADLQGADLTRADLIQANLCGANLMEADLSAADLSDADLTHTHLQRADFTNAILEGANLTSAQFVGPNGDNPPVLTGARLDDLIYAESQGSANSMLELATAIGLDTAKWTGLFDYIERAFKYAYLPNTPVSWDYPNVVEEALKRIKVLRELVVPSDAPTTLVDAIGTISAEIIKHLAQHPEAMHNLKPRLFEELIAEILASYGWEVQLTPPTNDGGYDIYAVAPTGAGLNTSYIVECKKWRDNVGVSVARALYGVKTSLGINNALLVTTADFTQGVRLLTSKWKLQTAGFHKIAEWLNEYHPLAGGKVYYKEEGGLILPGDPRWENPDG